MREIKFRAWMGEEHKMWPVMAGMGQVATEFGSIDEPIEVMQYTGLKDKNGKEIYEGDVLNAKVDSGHGSSFYDKGQVVFHPEAAQFILTKGGMVTNIGNDVEIIGNIYENPELLK